MNPEWLDPGGSVDSILKKKISPWVFYLKCLAEAECFHDALANLGNENAHPETYQFYSSGIASPDRVNPVGRGLIARQSTLKIDGMLLPNIENPAELIKKPRQRPRPVGFGVIPPHWQPRSGYAGTYDDAWRKSVSPLPPADLDPRFYCAAAPGLLSPRHLTGGEEVLVEGATPMGRLQFFLPGITTRAKLHLKRGAEELHLRLDTVIVEPDEARVVLVWRGAVSIHGQVHEAGLVSIEAG